MLNHEILRLAFLFFFAILLLIVGWSVSCKDGRFIDLIVTLLIKFLLIVDTFSLAAILK